MDIRARHVQCYLAEWYSPELNGPQFETAAARLDDCATAMSAQGSHVQLVMTLAVPADEVVFGVFDAVSEECVIQVCAQAGIPPGRLTGAADARITLPPS